MTVSSYPQWRMALYNRFGMPLGPIREALGRSMSLKMNDIDTLKFSVSFDNPIAGMIAPLETVVKVWRVIGEPGSPVYYAPTSPIFAGVVAPLTESGQDRKLEVTVNSPLWRLKYRFLRETVMLGNPSPLVGAAMDQSDMIWYLIDYTNAFDYTGIAKGNFETTLSRRRIFKRRSAIWESVQGLASLTDGVDMVARYYHDDGDPTMMYLDTVDAQAIFRPGVQFHWNVGRRNMGPPTRNFDVDQFATRVDLDAEANGLFNSAAVTDVDLLNRYGLYERVESVNNMTDNASLSDLGNAILDQYGHPLMTVEAQPDADKAPYFGKDYNLGDVVGFRSDDGRMSFALLKRIYGADLTMDDNDRETINLITARDSTGQVTDDNGNFNEQMENIDDGGEV